MSSIVFVIYFIAVSVKYLIDFNIICSLSATITYLCVIHISFIGRKYVNFNKNFFSVVVFISIINCFFSVTIAVKVNSYYSVAITVTVN